MKNEEENPVKKEEVPINYLFEKETRRTLWIIFTFSSFASQGVADSEECETVASKPNKDNISESPIKVDTKSRHPSSEKSIDDDSDSTSEVTAFSAIDWLSLSTSLSLMVWNHPIRGIGYIGSCSANELLTTADPPKFPWRNVPVVFASVQELDLTSTFVSKAADIARRKLEHNSKAEQKAKKNPVKERPETTPIEPKEDPPVTSWKLITSKHPRKVRLPAV